MDSETPTGTRDGSLVEVRESRLLPQFATPVREESPAITPRHGASLICSGVCLADLRWRHGGRWPVDSSLQGEATVAGGDSDLVGESD